MSREREIFCDALALGTEAEREAWVREACGGDATLLEAVHSLLAAHDGVVPDFLEPAGDGGRGEPVAEGPGSEVGRYRLLERIGEGGFGVVYLAEQREPVRRRVALKILKPGMDTRQVVSRFEVERQALALMDHPNIARVLDGGATERGRPYFVMEWVRGRPLTDHCDGRAATTRERLELFLDVCAAIQHAHQKGVVHRDIKPSNVLVTDQDGRAVPTVIDFGIAKAIQGPLTERAVLTHRHELLGTPAYMSPEQARLGDDDIDTRTDIYSLGVLLYELLAGRAPFEAGTTSGPGYEALRRAVLERDPVKPSTRVRMLEDTERQELARRRGVEARHWSRGLRGDLDWIVMKAIEKDRGRRYESASALAQDIRRHLANEAVSAAAPTWTYRMGKFVRRHGTAVTLAAGVVMLLVATSLASLGLALRALEAEEATSARLQTEQTAREQLERLLAQLQEARQRADDEARRARTEAAAAEAVTQFVTEDLFGLADPDREPEREVTLRAVMDRAAGRLPGGLEGQARVLASIHSVLGRVYLNLSEHDRAEAHLREAYNLWRGEYGEGDERTVRALATLSGALEQGGQTTPALALAQEAAGRAKALLGEDHPVTLETRIRLAWNFYRLRRHEEAFATASEAWALAERAAAAPEVDAYSALHLLARREGTAGRVEEGERLLRRGLRAHEERYGAHHLRTARARNNLGAYLYDYRRGWDEVESLYRESLATLVRLGGENHELTLTLRQNLALLYDATDRPDEALAHLLTMQVWRPQRHGLAPHLWRWLEAWRARETAVEGARPAVRWRHRREAPPVGWTDAGFDDAEWEDGIPAGEGDWWLRGVWDGGASEPGWAVRISGMDEGEAFVHGQPLRWIAPGGTEEAPQWGVQVRVSGNGDGPGREVLTIRGRWEAGGTPGVGVWRLPAGPAGGMPR